MKLTKLRKNLLFPEIFLLKRNRNWFTLLAISLLLTLGFQNCSDSSLVLPTIEEEPDPVIKQSVLSISKQTQLNAAVNFGAPVLLEVESEGVATVTYQWFFDGQPISGADQASYQIDLAKISDIGTYHVQVSGDGQTVDSDPMVLDLLPPEMILDTTTITKDHAGVVGTFDCPPGYLVAQASERQVPSGERGCPISVNATHTGMTHGACGAPNANNVWRAQLTCARAVEVTTQQPVDGIALEVNFNNLLGQAGAAQIFTCPQGQKVLSSYQTSLDGERFCGQNFPAGTNGASVSYGGCMVGQLRTPTICGEIKVTSPKAKFKYNLTSQIFNQVVAAQSTHTCAGTGKITGYRSHLSPSGSRYCGVTLDLNTGASATFGACMIANGQAGHGTAIICQSAESELLP